MTVIDSPTLSDSPPLPSDPAELQAALDEVIDELNARLTAGFRQVVADAAASITAASTPQAAWAEYVDEQIGPMLTTTYKGAALSTTIAAVPPPHIAALMAPVINQSAVDYARTATNRIVGAGNQLWGQVRSELTTTLATGGTTEELKATVERLSGYSEFRADTIARTEVMGAYNHGDNAAATSLGEYGPVEKQWLAAIDMRTRESHIEADGQIVPFKDDFIVGGSSMPFPGQGPPEEVINCRCVVLHLYPGDERPDGTIAGEEQPEAPSAGDQEVISFIQGQLANNPNMTTQQLLDAWKAQGKSIARQRFYGLAREAKGGSKVLPVNPAKVAARNVRKVVAKDVEAALKAGRPGPSDTMRVEMNRARTIVDHAQFERRAGVNTLANRATRYQREVWEVTDEARQLNKAVVNIGREVEERAAKYTSVTRDELQRLNLAARQANRPIMMGDFRAGMTVEEKMEFRRARRAIADAAEAEWNKARTAYVDAQRKALAEVRDMGEGTFNHTGYGKKALASAAKEYPTDWINALPEYQTSKVQRGYHSYRKIALSGDTDKAIRSTAVHELGHGMEDHIAGIKEAEHSFFWERAQRTGFDQKWVRTQNEWGFKDEWYTDYSGRVYSGGGTRSNFEVLTMGVEQMFGGWNGRLSQGLLDQEYERWVLGVMATF